VETPAFEISPKIPQLPGPKGRERARASKKTLSNLSSTLSIPSTLSKPSSPARLFFSPSSLASCSLAYWVLHSCHSCHSTVTGLLFIKPVLRNTQGPSLGSVTPPSIFHIPSLALPSTRHDHDHDYPNPPKISIFSTLQPVHPLRV
jgi:hypothetical protein